MAESGQPTTVNHVENAKMVFVTNISNSSVGNVIVSPTSGWRDEAVVENDGSEQTESDKIHGSKHQNKEKQMEEADITWLQNGRFGLYVKKPLHKDEKVYQGVQKLMSNTGRDVAIKRLVYQQKKRNEVDLLLKLQHPNIVQIIDAFDQRGDFHWIYIVMELCSQNLQNYIDENKLKQRDFKKLFSFSKQLVAGLAYLHQNKVIHRDLKPENVLISMCKSFLKLSDFGLSKEIQDSRSVATVTTIGAGSEGFRSPETYQTGRHISPRLDIFPLGLILHLLFTNGLHPFGPDPYDWRDNIRKNKNLDLSQIPDFVDANAPKKKQLLKLLNCMLQHEPLDRPTAEEVTKDSFFEDSSRESGNTIDEQIAKINISSSSTSSPPCEASTDTTRPLLEKISAPTEADSKQECFAKSQFEGSNIKAIKTVDAGLHSFTIENPSEAIRRIEESEERASYLMEKRRYQEATDVLRELYDYEGSNKLDVSLKIAECELYLQRGQEEDYIRQVRNVISTSKILSAGELQEMADKSYQNKQYVRSLILLQISHVLQSIHEVFPDDAVTWIARLEYRMSVNAEPLIETGGVSRDIGIRYGIEFMERLLNELRLVKNANTALKVMEEANCLVCITFLCNVAGEYGRSLPFGIDGVGILEKQFGSRASNYGKYWMMLNNVGVAYAGRGENSVAEKYIVTAIEVCRITKNVSEAQRKEKIDIAMQNLSRVREIIGKESFIFTETVAKEIGQGGGTIEVGGCFITFPSNTFQQATSVIAKANIDPNEWPAEMEGVTPSLDVDAPGMLKKATVKLTTWCIDENGDDDDIIIEVMHFNEGRKEWEVIHECPLGNSGFIEFECRQFSPIVALRRMLSRLMPPPSHLYRPVVYRAQREFILGLYLNTELVKNALHNDMKESLGNDVKVKRFQVMTCKKTDIVECDISCSAAQDEFVFEPPGPFKFTINHSMPKGEPSYTQCMLSGGQTEMDVRIIVNYTKEGENTQPQSFEHRWKPGYIEKSDTNVSPSLPENSLSSRQIPRPARSKIREVMTTGSSKCPLISFNVYAEDKSSTTGGIVNKGNLEASFTDYDNNVTVMKTHTEEDTSEN